jgi:hypothetical protein
VLSLLPLIDCWMEGHVKRDFIVEVEEMEVIETYFMVVIRFFAFVIYF